MKRRTLVLSTGNRNKVEEIKDILKHLPVDVLSKDELGLKDIDVDEDGETLEENAIKKAKSIKNKVDGMVMADDTGLFVDYLKGEPGIKSARYSDPDANDEKNIEKLLSKLEGVPLEKRTAIFRTVIALITEKGDVITVTGECKGYIGFEKKGHSGFGYDPIFIVDGYGKTFAELGNDIKNNISHRAKALEKMRNVITDIIKDGRNEDNSCQ
ncbi:MAG: RdgB/HAM1 family non-canonical purine NTP pyrophosphatase [Tissierellia bacterium]|nr:RdgB/HAM1 family non-canonical purine NTP pyrophosphatase [Tissierellia bacterium]